MYNLFHHVSIMFSYVSPFSKTKVALKITGGVSNSLREISTNQTWSPSLVCMRRWWYVWVWGHVSVYVCVLKHVYMLVLQCHPNLENDLLKWNYAVPWPMANGMSRNLSSSWAVNKIWLAIIWLCCGYSIPSSTSFLLSPILSPPHHGCVDLRVTYYWYSDLGSASRTLWWW